MATIAIGQRIGSGGAELGALIARRLEARFLGLAICGVKPPASTGLIRSSCACSIRASHTFGTG
jgi:hypothetical protein